MSQIEFERVLTNGVTLHCAVAGEGPVLVLLHGFPEFWRCWEGQIEELARDFRLVIPDLRGYGLSDKPVSGYNARSTAADLYGLIRYFCGSNRARVAGHDWGGYAAWALAYLAPESLRRITVLNSPQPWMYLRRLFVNGQVFKAWYVMFFQVPGIAEWFLTREEGAGVETVLRRGSTRFERFPREYIDACRQQMLEPGAAPATLEWYRTAFRYSYTGARFMRGTTNVPVQMIWGNADPALSESLTTGLERYAPHHRVDILEGVGHYVTHEAAGRVGRLVREWMLEE
ncbi:MAG TPA: alpha/beta fold hydrolase [Thermoanaerobaculia bacterium]